MGTEKLYQVTFIFFNGMQLFQNGYSKDFVDKIVNTFMEYKERPELSEVQKFVPPDGIGVTIVIDLKNLMAITYQ
jgi:hypothetical protein